MKRLGIIGVLLGALALSACTQDVVIRNSEGVTVVGQVQGEYVNSKVEIRADNAPFETLGIFSTQRVSEPFANGWSDLDNTSLIEKQFDVKLSTGVTYIGTKGKATMLIDTRTVSCPVGFMVGTCLSAIEENEVEVLKLYKEKFSYLK